MTEQARQRALGDAVQAALSERAGSESYQRSQRRVRRGRGDPVDRARPLEFDQSGFPVAQHSPSFVQRVARLLNPK